MLLQEIKKANMEALKTKDSNARAIYSVLINKCMLLEINKREKGEELEDADVVSLIQKTLKELEDEISNFEKVNNAAKVESLKGQMEYIKKWFDEYGFSLDIITEACNRTITNTHKPDFKYTDSILSNWLKSGVHHLSDIANLDRSYLEEKTAKKRSVDKPAANRFNNFEGRSYDMNSLEQQLLNTN